MAGVAAAAAGSVGGLGGGGGDSSSAPSVVGVGGGRPLLAGPDVCWVVMLYRKVYCAYHDRATRTLRLYRMFR
jgi:hypothetical protein